MVSSIETARAAEVQGLYEAEAWVTSQAADEREATLRVLLSEVLVRVTGDSAAPSAAALADVMAQPERLVQQYLYQAGGIGQPIRLWARFDAGAVNRLLQEADLPVWGESRPVSLVWLAVEDGGQRWIVNPDSSAASEALNAAAQRRGIPLVIPLMDLEDRALVRFQDIWGGFHEAVLEASRRYQADAVLVGRLNREAGGEWRGRWSLYEGGAATHWETHAAQFNKLVGSGIDATADKLASRYALPAGDLATYALTLEVEGIADFAAYGRTLHYLTGLAPVAGVQVSSVTPERVTYRLELHGDLTGLQRAIDLGNTLVAVTVPDSSETAVPLYRLAP